MQLHPGILEQLPLRRRPELLNGPPVEPGKHGHIPTTAAAFIVSDAGGNF
jgi:hypothetical protein